MGLFGKKKKQEDKKKVEQKTPGFDVKKQQGTKELYSENKEIKKESVSKIKDKKIDISKRQKGAYRILVKPLITEKVTMMGAENKYAFAVVKKANKVEVSKAIEEVYGIRPISVNMVNVKGKKVRYGRTSGKRKDWKKAIVKLPAGKSIKVYEGV